MEYGAERGKAKKTPFTGFDVRISPQKSGKKRELKKTGLRGLNGTWNGGSNGELSDFSTHLEPWPIRLHS